MGLLGRTIPNIIEYFDFFNNRFVLVKKKRVSEIIDIK